MSKPEQVPSVGRVVHYVLGDEAGLRRGEVRPAIVVAMRHPETPNLQLLSDGPNDFPGILNGTLWRGSVPFGGPDQPGTWFWPPHVPAKPAAPTCAPPREVVEKAERIVYVPATPAAPAYTPPREVVEKATPPHGPLDPKRTGFLGFTTYNDVPGPHGPWKTFDGRDVPGWDAVGPLTQTRWVAAGTAERDVAFSIAGHAAVQELEKAGITDDETLNRVQVAILRHRSDSVSPPDPLPRDAVIS